MLFCIEIFLNKPSFRKRLRRRISVAGKIHAWGRERMEIVEWLIGWSGRQICWERLS